MHLSTALASACALFLSTAAAHPASVDMTGAAEDAPSPYTVTVLAPKNAKFNGARTQLESYVRVFEERVADYCPEPPELCPNGTQTAFRPNFQPDSMVPGGQFTYVTPQGEFMGTPQHSSSWPAGSYAYGEGWHWHALSADDETGLDDCPRDDKKYNCQRPAGYYTFRAPDAKDGEKGGVVLCQHGEEWLVWAVTPKFKREGCMEVKGAGRA